MNEDDVAGVDPFKIKFKRVDNTLYKIYERQTDSNVQDKEHKEVQSDCECDG